MYVLESLILIFGYLILVPPPCSRRECKMMKNIGWLATEYWISSFLSRVTKKRANKFRRPTFISMFGIIFFLLFSFWSGWSGYIILYVHSKSHINDYFVNARQIKTNIHVFFSWHGFLQVVLLLIRKKSGGSFMLNLRPFFQLKENVPICTIRFFLLSNSKIITI